MSISLRCGESIYKSLEVNRQVALEKRTPPWPTPEFLAGSPEKRKQILEALARDALFATVGGLEELDAAKAELKRMAENDGTACGPCQNGGVCPLVINTVGREDVQGFDVIMVVPISRPDFVGVQITFNYKVEWGFRFTCNDQGCHQ